MDKEHIIKAFSRNTLSYESQAVVQQQVSAKLLSAVHALQREVFPCLLEIGCGTGLLSQAIFRELNFQQGYLNDLLPLSSFPSLAKRIEQSDKKINYLHGDIETIELPIALDLIISSSSLQWVTDLPKLVDKLSSKQTSGGLFAFTTFGTENFKEIKALLNIGLNYYNEAEIITIFSKYYRLLHVENWVQTCYFDQAKSVLQHIKGTGTNAFSDQVTASKLRNFSVEYKRQFSHDNGQLSLSYHPMLFIFERK